MKYWEVIADNLKQRGWSLGWVSAVDSERRTIWITDAHSDDGKRFVVHADEKLTAFLEIEAAMLVRRGPIYKLGSVLQRNTSTFLAKSV